MDYITRQFINLTKKLRKESRRALTEFTAAVEKNTKAAEKSARAQERQADTNVLILSGIEALRARGPEKRSNEQPRQPMEWIKLSVAVATLLVAAAYTALTAYQLIQLKISAEAARDAAEAAKTSSDIAVLTERPWIKIVDVQTAGNNPIVPALSFQYPGPPQGRKGTQVTFQLDIGVKNVGHTVTNIDVDADLILPKWDSNHFVDEVVGAQKKFCDGFRGQLRDAPTLRAVVFPGDPFHWHMGAATIVSPESTIEFSNTGAKKFIVPVVIVCVNYRFQGSSVTYQTQAVYEIFRKDTRMRFFEVGKGIYARNILLERDPFGDVAY